MSDLVDTLESDGRRAEIYYDQDCGQPYEDDEGVKIVVLHRRYSDPAKGECGDTPSEVHQWVEDNNEEWWIINLWMLDHSGTYYRVADGHPFPEDAQRWDSGQVGIIAIKRSEWGCKDDAEFRKAAQAVADEYTDWANGQCFGYRVLDAKGKELDACWGFIGLDNVKAAAQEALAHK
jgi:hypothetical protein